MSPSKRFENEWADKTKPQVGLIEAESCAVEIGEAELTRAAERWHWLRTMLGRAAGAYVVLFLVLGLGMSALGANPLANNGLMLKVLFIFVGLALLLALASSLTDLFREQGRNWLRIVRKQQFGEKSLDE